MVADSLKLDEVLENIEDLLVDDNTKELLESGKPAYVMASESNSDILKIYPDGKKEIIKYKKLDDIE